MQRLQARRLSALDHAAVVALEHRIYPPGTQEHPELIAARLQFEDERYSSLNLGLFDGEALVGYVLAHLDDGAEFPDASIGDNVYVADMAILPEHRRHLVRLISALLRECRHEYPGLPIAGHAIGTTGGMWRRHQVLLRRLGFVLSRQIDNVSMPGGYQASLLVWTPTSEAASPARARGRATAVQTRSGRRLDVRVVSDEDGLRALATAWRNLEPGVPGLTVFQTFAYQAAWVRAFGLAQEIFVLCIQEGPEIVGIAPFQVSPVHIYGKVHRQLSFLGAPWEVDRPRFLFARDPEECARAAARTLLAHRDRWDLAWFHEQDATDPALRAFCNELQAHSVLHGRAPGSHCPYLTLRGGWQPFLATKSQKFRKNLRSSKRKLEALGPLEYATCAGEADRLHALLAEYESLERRSWKAKGGVGVTQSVEHLRFYHHLIDAFGADGRFVLRTLRVGGQLVAATFGLVHDRRYYSLHIAHDAAYAAHSPGTLLEALELEECFDSGIEEYEFLGGFLKNKVRWTDQMRDTVFVHLYQRRPRLIAGYAFYFHLKPRLKRALDRLGLRWPGQARTDRVEAPP